MIIRDNIQHKGLERFVKRNDHRGISTDFVTRIRAIISALGSADRIEHVQGPPGWHIHPMTGDRAGTWSISVKGNWRITFKIDQGDIIDLNLEDYH
jgi:proteic killer suppression protein